MLTRGETKQIRKAITRAIDDIREDSTKAVVIIEKVNVTVNICNGGGASMDVEVKR
jgi:hypothetical protein